MKHLWISFIILMASSVAHAYVAEVDVVYDTISNTKLSMDIFRPSRPTNNPRPALIFLHGGCFNTGSRKDIPEDMKLMADEGFTVFSIGYRLSTVAKYPAAVIDVQQGIRYIRKNADQLMVDPEQIIVHGESAGGYLAAVMGVRQMPSRKGIIDQYSSRVQLVSDWYGRTDFTAPQTTGTDCAASFLGLARNPENHEAFKRASILTDINKYSAPFFIIHGTNDQQVYPLHSTLLANKLWSLGKPAELYFNENEGHAFSRDTPWILTKKFIMEFVGMTAKKLKKESPFYEAEFQLYQRLTMRGNFDLELKFAQGPKVSVMTSVGARDFKIDSTIRGRIGLISKSKVFNLQQTGFTRPLERHFIHLDWSSKKLE